MSSTHARPRTGTDAAVVRNLRYRYPDAARPALDGVSLTLRAGELVVLAGPSGGGKSTLLRALAGLVPHFHGGRFGGTVVVDGLDTRRARPAEIARRAGLAFQDPEAQAVHEHVLRDVAFGLQQHGTDPVRLLDEARRALAAVGAEALADRRVQDLSGGELQRVQLAGVLAPRPALLLLDEPTAQLDDAGAAALVALLRSLADQGLAVVAAEHRLDRIAGSADRLLGIDEGRLCAAEQPPDPAARARLPLAAGAPRTAALTAAGIVADRGGRRVLEGATLAIAPGEVVALVGQNGCGKTTLLRILAGLDAPRAGTVNQGGRDISDLPAERRWPALALVVQDPGRHLLCERVDQELGFGLGHLRDEDARARIVDALRLLELEAFAARHPHDLSVGERERVALGSALAADPAVLLLDEPTRGMDARRRQALVDLLRARAARGRSCLLVSHDLRVARAAADRVLVLEDGRLRELAP